MIDVEIEDEAWAAGLPNVELIVINAAELALASPPLRGRRRPPEQVRGDGGVSATSANLGAHTAIPDPFPQEGGDVTVLLANDEAVKDLNDRFRAKSAPTNVLSFPAPATAAPHLGDIVLAYGVCAREALAQGKPLSHHLMHLTAHGVLHLLGYDHETDADAEGMEALEREILAGLGVPDPYAPTLTPRETDEPV